jgi:hypothetical protein
MNSLRRWLHRSEREHELLLVRLWTSNTLEAAEPEQEPQVSELAIAAKTELKASLKYLSTEEIEQTIAEVITHTEYDRQVRRKLRKQIKHRRAAGA